MIRVAVNSLGGTRAICVFLVLVALGVTLLPIRPALAEYPERTITIIVPFAPGAITDVLARIVGAYIQEKVGQSVVVQNRPGGGANIGIVAAARAKPDGYTFLSTSDVFFINPSLYRNASYDALNDFAPVADLITAPNVIVVSKDSDIKTLPQLIEIAKKNPSLLDYSSPGVGTAPHAAIELLKLKAGINILHVPYPGATPAIQAVLGNTVKVGAIAMSGVHALIMDGRLRALAVFGPKRWHDLPDVPTVEEAGISIPSGASNNSNSLFAPAGTPKEIIDKISRLAIEAMLESKNKQQLEKNGNQIVAKGPEALGERVSREVPAWKEILTTVGIKID